jgi:hypothetical protein
LKVAHFDPVTGASGDMILGALIDAGAPLATIRERLATLPLPPFEIDASETRHRGFRCTRLNVRIPDEQHQRHLSDVARVIRGGGLSPTVVEGALRVFHRLAEAEAQVHGIPVEDVHFHEVGALDAIVDVTGTLQALELLGVRRVTFSALRVGTGEVDTAHGRLPVPVPAVVELTKGLPVVRTDIPGEILTPTGAALLVTLGRPMNDRPFVADAVGVSCGSRELPGRPNLLRVSIGAWQEEGSSSASIPWEHDEVVVLETNLDDLTPEMLPAVLEEAMAAGALDAFVTPVLMKKGRPGYLVTASADPASAEKVAAALFRETTTFGVRRHLCPRWKLAREIREVDSPWGKVRVKVGDLGGGMLRVAPEYESCRAVADRTGTPLVEVYRKLETIIQSIELKVTRPVGGIP